ASFADLSLQDLFGNWIFEVLLDRSFQRPCTKVAVESFFCPKLLGCGCQLYTVTQCVDALEQCLQPEVDDLEDAFLIHRGKDNHIINPVKEFRGKRTFEGILDHTA